jgi:parallel beta-helix repeat protein
MRRILFSVALAACVLSLPVGSSLAAPVSGAVEKDTTWSGSVEVSGEVSVALSATLTVAPGTLVRFAPGAALLVSGRLVARGEPDKTVSFLPAAADAPPSSWRGIVFTGAQEGSELTRCRVTGATVGVEANGTSLRIADSVFEKGTTAVRLALESRTRVERNEIRDMSTGGVEVGVGVAALVEGNRIERCKEFGIVKGFGGGPRVQGNTVRDCGVGIGITGEGANVVENAVDKCRIGIGISQVGGEMLVAGNRVKDCETGIFLNQFASPLVSDNTVEGCKEGIHCFQASSPAIVQNRIDHNERGIGCVQLCEPLIEKNLISRSKEGVYLHLSSYARIAANNFEENAVSVALDNMSADWETRVGKKPVRSGRARNLTMAEKGKAVARELPDAYRGQGFVDAEGNWWGTATAQEMEKKGADAEIAAIRDFYDVPKRSYEGYEGEYIQDKVRYSPWLPAPVADAGPRKSPPWKQPQDKQPQDKQPPSSP